MTDQSALERAYQSLEGLSVGDAFGVYHGDRRLPLIAGQWHWTDDSNMAFSIAESLRLHGEIDQDALAASFAAHYADDRGYALGARKLLKSIQNGGVWREQVQLMFGGEGSFGNGSAMRVAPVGAYFADDLDAVVEQARRSAQVTHAHPEGIAGAIAVALAAALAWSLRDNQPNRKDFIDQILPLIPKSEVADKARKARDLAPGANLHTVIGALGNGSKVTCQDTVPFALWCAGETLYDFEEALWLTASGGGDRDTTCAMVGGIVVMSAGVGSIPVEFLKHREPIPDWARQR